jgi:hypothetical protein
VVVPDVVLLVEVVPGDVLLLVVVELVELVELPGLRPLAGLLVWAEQRPLALTRAAAAMNSLRAVFIDEVFLLRLVASEADWLRGAKKSVITVQ